MVSAQLGVSLPVSSTEVVLVPPQLLKNAKNIEKSDKVKNRMRLPANLGYFELRLIEG